MQPSAELAKTKYMDSSSDEDEIANLEVFMPVLRYLTAKVGIYKRMGHSGRTEELECMNDTLDNMEKEEQERYRQGCVHLGQSQIAQNALLNNFTEQVLLPQDGEVWRYRDVRIMRTNNVIDLTQDESEDEGETPGNIYLYDADQGSVKKYLLTEGMKLVRVNSRNQQRTHVIMCSSTGEYVDWNPVVKLPRLKLNLIQESNRVLTRAARKRQLSLIEELSAPAKWRKLSVESTPTAERCRTAPEEILNFLEEVPECSGYSGTAQTNDCDENQVLDHRPEAVDNESSETDSESCKDDGCEAPEVEDKIGDIESPPKHVVSSLEVSAESTHDETEFIFEDSPEASPEHSPEVSLEGSPETHDQRSTPEGRSTPSMENTFHELDDNFMDFTLSPSEQSSPRVGSEEDNMKGIAGTDFILDESSDNASEASNDDGRDSPELEDIEDIESSPKHVVSSVEAGKDSSVDENDFLFEDSPGAHFQRSTPLPSSSPSMENTFREIHVDSMDFEQSSSAKTTSQEELGKDTMKSIDGTEFILDSTPTEAENKEVDSGPQAVLMAPQGDERDIVDPEDADGELIFTNGTELCSFVTEYKRQEEADNESIFSAETEIIDDSYMRAAEQLAESSGMEDEPWERHSGAAMEHKDLRSEDNQDATPANQRNTLENRSPPMSSPCTALETAPPSDEYIVISSDEETDNQMVVKKIKTEKPSSDTDDDSDEMEIGIVVEALIESLNQSINNESLNADDNIIDTNMDKAEREPNKEINKEPKLSEIFVDKPTNTSDDTLINNNNIEESLNKLPSTQADLTCTDTTIRDSPKNLNCTQKDVDCTRTKTALSEKGFNEMLTAQPDLACVNEMADTSEITSDVIMNEDFVNEIQINAEDFGSADEIYLGDSLNETNIAKVNEVKRGNMDDLVDKTISTITNTVCNKSENLNETNIENGINNAEVNEVKRGNTDDLVDKTNNTITNTMCHKLESLNETNIENGINNAEVNEVKRGNTDDLVDKTISTITNTECHNLESINEINIENGINNAKVNEDLDIKEEIKEEPTSDPMDAEELAATGILKYEYFNTELNIDDVKDENKAENEENEVKMEVTPEMEEEDETREDCFLEADDEMEETYSDSSSGSSSGCSNLLCEVESRPVCAYCNAWTDTGKRHRCSKKKLQNPASAELKCVDCRKFYPSKKELKMHRQDMHKVSRKRGKNKKTLRKERRIECMKAAQAKKKSEQQ